MLNLARLFGGKKSNPKAIFVLDSKATGEIMLAARQAGIADIHCFVANGQGRFTLDPAVRGNHYADAYRTQELQQIAEYHERKGVRAIIIPVSASLKEEDASSIIKKIKNLRSLDGMKLMQIGGDRKLMSISAHLSDIADLPDVLASAA